MARVDYFEMLEGLSKCALEAVEIVFRRKNAETKRMSDLRDECDRIVCAVERRLFSDFIPPIQRGDIALCAHSISRVVDCACELWLDDYPNGSKRNMLEDGGEICITLAESICFTVKLLKDLRNPGCIPEVDKFRKKLRDGRTTAENVHSRVRCGSLPRSKESEVRDTERLRCEISECFDRLVEVMLNNI